jgi:hypothetical protein
MKNIALSMIAAVTTSLYVNSDIEIVACASALNLKIDIIGQSASYDKILIPRSQFGSPPTHVLVAHLFDAHYLAVRGIAGSRDTNDMDVVDAESSNVEPTNRSDQSFF